MNRLRDDVPDEGVVPRDAELESVRVRAEPRETSTERRRSLPEEEVDRKVDRAWLDETGERRARVAEEVAEEVLVALRPEERETRAEVPDGVRDAP